MLSLDVSQLQSFLPDGALAHYEDRLRQASEWINTHTGPGGDYTGWIHYPKEFDTQEFDRISCAQKYSSGSLRYWSWSELAARIWVPELSLSLFSPPIII